MLRSGRRGPEWPGVRLGGPALDSPGTREGRGLPTDVSHGSTQSRCERAPGGGEPAPLRQEGTDDNGDSAPDDARDSDGDGLPDYLDPDDDGDGTPTREEILDADGDGVQDEVLDSEGDGLPD